MVDLAAGEELRVMVPARDRVLPSPLAAWCRMTELRQERIRSDGVLWDDSFPIDEAMLWRGELVRLRSLREMAEWTSQFA